MTLVNISADPLMLSEYIEMHMRARSRTPITDSTCSRYLPLTLTPVEKSDEWLVQIAPIFRREDLELKMKEYLSGMEKLPVTGGAWQKKERNVETSLRLFLATIPITTMSANFQSVPRHWLSTNCFPSSKIQLCLTRNLPLQKTGRTHLFQVQSSNSAFSPSG